ncbi:hypothetical protein ACR8AL_07330 [Clavibacter sepedonicus]|uniref:Membrane protein n=1 Tax=Clavibacter sepedonicus TaxID=31964 RepID=B0RJC7_CLASE|nr:MULTISPECIES: hypothetical protein [Clavibacter]MBD5382494.1 hypothetical protein [Clavibacter sp.]OQJ45262.1 hypothetical protein B5P19_15475 [Clavibacter sepedonicus]OQJ50949.1 hypothetical protein B5P20_16110 [Clavibacter sepedonicus]UUK67246.1 hypothetical protein LRE50_15925 [Clavibacter sepedonicus]CAQ03317.1 putative membrane protein [Clavibacter sepedonicus]
MTIIKRLGSPRHALARLREDDGYAGDAIVLPGIVLMVFFGVQIALWFQGTNIAQSAATAAYSTARAYQADSDSGRAAGEQVLTQAGGYLTSPNVSVERAPTTVTVTVTGRALSLIPGVTLPEVSRTVTGPIERWVPAS